MTATPFSEAYATTRVKAPSSSRMFVWIRSAIAARTVLSGIRIPSRSAFFLRIAIRVSRSGGWTSVISPHSKRERSRSSSAVISFGGRSDDRTIWPPASYTLLKVWKNSSWMRSLPAKNWMSSIRSTSYVRYRALNSSRRLSCKWAMKSFMNASPVRYRARRSDVSIAR